ncbi:ABC transporter, substrate binding protein, PQQ-dependent alcohol dehydrogenase system [Roseivivax lentus]|uniref:ABC transporter, substrate binding protein, PQQ-dependent alcohol dehydrogenase system n=1 Tax=Roseivivax lentus TaxID=633194 RepID=A0A1N7JZA2_9RHOB|nr:ABC transporter substrate-binding protein [Roseivivax lentus]SIS54660.1 ABC transporter, substrate binding protein, PQQ-dependent alcohol dehydrogenase system [Roseivivax lentus]
MHGILRGLVVAFGLFVSAAAAQTPVAVEVTYLRQVVPPPPTLSNLDPRPEDRGPAGAALGLSDNATTGRFLGQDWSLELVDVAPGADWAAAVADRLATDAFVLLDAPAEQILAAADAAQAAGSAALLINVSAEATDLRAGSCRANLLHTVPSLAMRADALAQMFVKKRWEEIALIAGQNTSDQAYAAALRASLAKFGLGLEAETDWTFDADMRRSAAAEVPLLTQPLGDYDVLLVADEVHDFGRYILYNTWAPRPVAGSEGLTAEGWAPVVEQWGAAQLQSRFQEASGRQMLPRDYAAWAAMRSLGEAVTRTGSADPATLRDYMLGPDFELAGFLGRPLTFRPWNGQLRQPIPIVHPRALVAQAPLEGFLHQVNELDTLGLDRGEAGCTAFE